MNENNVYVYNTWITPDNVFSKPYNGMAYRKALDLIGYVDDHDVYFDD